MRRRDRRRQKILRAIVSEIERSSNIIGEQKPTVADGDCDERVYTLFQRSRRENSRIERKKPKEKANINTKTKTRESFGIRGQTRAKPKKSGRARFVQCLERRRR
jgi:hypothetical protein